MAIYTGNKLKAGSLDPNKYATKQEVELKQNITDENLTTTDKTIVGAINELNGKEQPHLYRHSILLHLRPSPTEINWITFSIYSNNKREIENWNDLKNWWLGGSDRQNDKYIGSLNIMISEEGTIVSDKYYPVIQIRNNYSLEGDIVCSYIDEYKNKSIVITEETFYTITDNVRQIF